MSELKPTPGRMITEEWLKEAGFKWHDVQGRKHWVLWLGDAVRDGGLTSTEDLGVELAEGCSDGTSWYCWLRGDYSHRYSRFIHIRHLRAASDLIRLIEGLTGQDWTRANVWYGSLVTPKQAEYFRKERQRLDIQFIEGSHPWNELERDESRGYPLSEHQRLLTHDEHNLGDEG